MSNGLFYKKKTERSETTLRHSIFDILRFCGSLLMKFHTRGSGVQGLNSEPQNRRITNRSLRRAQSCRISKGGIPTLYLFYKIDRSTQKLTTGRIHSFDIRHSLFDIRFFKVSFSIRPAVFLVGGWTDT